MYQNKFKVEKREQTKENKFINNNRTLNLIPTIFLALLTVLFGTFVYFVLF
jgi:hypothetical protein